MAKFCSSCGKPVQVKSNYCIFCGEKSTVSQGAIEPNFNEKRAKVLGTHSKNTSTKKGYLAAIVIIFSSGIWFFFRIYPVRQIL